MDKATILCGQLQAVIVDVGCWQVCVRALDIGQQFVPHHKRRSDEFINRIITIYESMVHHVKPENKSGVVLQKITSNEEG